MQAIWIEKYGDHNVLQLKTVEKPTVTGNQVLVQIASAGVNPVDTYIRSGNFTFKNEVPFTPGKDGAGIVREIGPKVEQFKVGQRVFVCKRHLDEYGTYAEYVLVNEEDAFPLPDCLSFEEGAALGIPYFTAYRALVHIARCQPGEFVLIHGASGAVGLAAVQMAKHLKLKVTGTAGTSEGMALVKRLGADFAVCHREKDYMDKIMDITGAYGTDIVLEMLANVNLDNDFDIMAQRGRIVIVGSRGPTQVDPRKMMSKELTVSGCALMNCYLSEWKDISTAVINMCKEGVVKPFIDRKYALADAAKAHYDIINSTGAKGKLILTVNENLS